MTAPLPLTLFAGWLAMGERGLSSEAIVSHLTGSPIRRPGDWTPAHLHYPHDPDDFRRCQLLLEQVPLARLAFDTMRSASPQWARLVDAWDEIHALIESEAPGYLHSRSGRAPRAYRLLWRVIDDGTPCATCEGTGQAEDCPKCKGTGRRSGGRCRACWSRGYVACAPCRGRGYTTERAA